MSNQAHDVKRTVEAKTTAYTVTVADGGKIFTNRGASGSVTWTLPTVAAAFTKLEVTVYGVAAQNIVVTTETADQMVVLNDATATSITFSESGHIIGNGAKFVCDGTSWLCFLYVDELSTVVIA